MHPYCSSNMLSQSKGPVWQWYFCTFMQLLFLRLWSPVGLFYVLSYGTFWCSLLCDALCMNILILTTMKWEIFNEDVLVKGDAVDPWHSNINLRKLFPAKFLFSFTRTVNKEYSPQKTCLKMNLFTNRYLYLRLVLQFKVTVSY